MNYHTKRHTNDIFSTMEFTTELALIFGISLEQYNKLPEGIQKGWFHAAKKERWYRNDWIKNLYDRIIDKWLDPYDDKIINEVKEIINKYKHTIIDITDENVKTEFRTIEQWYNKIVNRVKINHSTKANILGKTISYSTKIEFDNGTVLDEHSANIVKEIINECLTKITQQTLKIHRLSISQNRNEEEDIKDFYS